MDKNKVYQLRQRHSIDQTAFARIVYTTLRTVQRWEAGVTPVCPARFELAAMKLADSIALEQVGESK